MKEPAPIRRARLRCAGELLTALAPSSLLITGPAASGKSRAALDRFLSFPDSLLVTPSATMAEHVRHQLARAKAPVRPSRITTLAQCLDQWSPLKPVSETQLHFLIREALDAVPTPRFSRVAEFPGFHRAIAALLEEAPVNALGGVFGEDLARLFRDVYRGLAERGMGLRNQRLQTCSLDASPAHLVFDGFFSFSEVELNFVERIAARSNITLTLPEWPGNDAIQQRLLSRNFTEQRQAEIYRKPRRRVLCAPTLERETEEIASRILDEHSKGRAFGEMGIILRTRDPYLRALGTVLARFGIPARFYFSNRLDAHPAVRYLSGLVRTMLQGWDHASLLALLRMPVSGVGATPAGDRLDFELRRRLPGAGLPLHGVDQYPELVPVIRSLEAYAAWVRDRLGPQEWAARLKSLRQLLPQPVVADGLSRDQIQILRSTEDAFQAWESAIDETALVLLSAGRTVNAGRMKLEEFWRQAETALALEPLRASDRRRDVVHVMDVFEARQWELPVVFVCGLVERHFPQYHREDSLLSDAARRRAGLQTSEDRQAEEQFLFDLAVTRATEDLLLSYPRLDDRGEEALPSFFLQDVDTTTCETRFRPRPVRPPSDASMSAIHDPDLKSLLAGKHKTLAPTAIESFLQCPFQFFAAKTLRLRPRPAAPRDRLDLLLQGSILHRALAELARLPLLGRALIDEVFDDEIGRARVPRTYRTEAVRLELSRHFEAFLDDRQVALGWTSRAEEKFSFALNPLLTITGRIDRLDVGPRQQALVIDYKYSAGNKIRERVEENGEGHLVQGGLYLLASQKSFGLVPAGMLYCGLRKDVVWDGWHVPIPGIEAVGAVSTGEVLNELMSRAESTAVSTFEAITSGHIAPAPADTDKCRWCDFRDICRIETAAAVKSAGSI